MLTVIVPHRRWPRPSSPAWLGNLGCAGASGGIVVSAHADRDCSAPTLAAPVVPGVAGEPRLRVDVAAKAGKPMDVADGVDVVYLGLERSSTKIRPRPAPRRRGQGGEANGRRRRRRCGLPWSGKVVYEDPPARVHHRGRRASPTLVPPPANDTRTSDFSGTKPRMAGSASSSQRSARITDPSSPACQRHQNQRFFRHEAEDWRGDGTATAAVPGPGGC